MKQILKRRAVLDIGSGQTKVQIADICQKSGKIQNTHFQKSVQLLFTADYKKNDGYLSQDIQSQGLKEIKNILQENQHLNIEEFYGVATEAFRKAKNGQQYIEQLGENLQFNIDIITPENEAKYGYMNAKALSNLEKENLVSWDCGAGSFQMSYFSEEKNQLENYHGPHGSGTILNYVMKNLRKNQKNSSPSPMGREDIDNVLNYLHRNLPEVPQFLMKKQGLEFVGIGSDQSIFNQQRVLGGTGLFDQELVRNSIQECLGLQDREIYELEGRKFEELQMKNPGYFYKVQEGNSQYVVPKLCLLLGVMQKCQIKQVQFYQTHGNCAALLADDCLWGQQ